MHTGRRSTNYKQNLDLWQGQFRENEISRSVRRDGVRCKLATSKSFVHTSAFAIRVVVLDVWQGNDVERVFRFGLDKILFFFDVGENGKDQANILVSA